MRSYRIIIPVLLFAFLFSGAQTSYADEDISLCVMHKGSGQVITDEGGDRSVQAAGLTRLAALLVISEAAQSKSLELSRRVCVSKTASEVPGQTAFLEANETISAEDLYKSAAMICAGDAIYALAEATCGSEERFTETVNGRLAQLGVSARYSGALGDGMAISAKDIARISCALSDCECYTKYSSIYMDSITHSDGRVTELVNQNRLIRSMQGCKGLATGSSDAAGYCGSFYTERNGCGYICVILGAKNSKMRFERAQSETEAVYTLYRETEIATKGETVLPDYPVIGSCEGVCDIVAANSLCVLSSDGGKTDIGYNLPEKLTAPVSAGDCVGNLVCTSSDGSILGTVELTVKSDIKAAGFPDFIVLVIKTLING